jgi:hypothetical protein
MLAVSGWDDKVGVTFFRIQTNLDLRNKLDSYPEQFELDTDCGVRVDRACP